MTDKKPSDYYDRGGISVRQFAEAKGFDYSEGSLLKYLTRYKFKGNPVGDLEKLVEIAEYLLKREKEKRP